MPASVRRADAVKRRCLALLAGLLLAGGAGAAPAAADALDPATATFVLGNVQFLLVHELAHLVIGELQVPVLGPEENAADYLAAAALIRMGRRDPAVGARNGQYLLAAADAQRMAWSRGTELGAPAPYWDAHALTIQRFYQIACLLYGADPDTYADLPARVGLPPARAAGCGAEFAKANRGIDWLIATYGRKPGEPPGAAIAIHYEPPPTQVSARIIAQMRRESLVESLVGRLDELFRLPAPATLVLRRCGHAEAAWQPEQRELAVCYELLDTLYRMAPRERRD
jgi:hypothetical protein